MSSGRCPYTPSAGAPALSYITSRLQRYSEVRCSYQAVTLTVRAVSNHSSGEGAYLFAQVGIGFHQGLDVPMLDVRGLHAGPLRARKQGVVGSSR